MKKVKLGIPKKSPRGKNVFAALVPAAAALRALPILTPIEITGKIGMGNHLFGWQRCCAGIAMKSDLELCFDGICI